MSVAGPLTLRSFGASDVGRRRAINEDAFLCDDELGLWVVADGMGGHAAGEVASRESIDTIFGMVRRGKESIDFSGEPSEKKARAACRVLEGAVQGATYLLFAMAELDRGKAGMGTTISAMMSFGDSVAVGQVGDSRIYRVRDGNALQLTEDHTLIAWQLKQGLITADEARVSKQRNVITRAVGSRDYVQVDTSVWEVEPGDAYLLCSDGLHGYLQLDEIADILEEGGAAAVEQLIELANARGGKDNITAVVVEVSGFPARDKLFLDSIASD
jgi:serine/threonine protein phosphatase PrpC